MYFLKLRSELRQWNGSTLLAILTSVTLLGVLRCHAATAAPDTGKFVASYGVDTASRRLVLRTVTYQTKVYCGSDCLADEFCGGFNFRRLTSTVECELVAGMSLSGDVWPRAGSVFYDRVGDIVVYPRDCYDYVALGQDPVGVTPIDALLGGSLVRTEVWCESGGWTILNKRFDGSVDYDMLWDDYKSGFGNANGEYFIGNDLIHKITNYRDNEAKVDVTRFNGQSAYATYDLFKVESEADLYRLTVGAFTGGSAGDSLTPHSGMYFTTSDRDNDLAHYNCAKEHKGGSWWHGCSNMRMTCIWGENVPDLEIIGPGPVVNSYTQGNWWASWLGSENPEQISLKVRPKV